MSKGQNKILDSLMEEHLDVNGLISRTGLSASFVRNSLKYLESTGQVEKVDKRIPYMYKIPLDNPLIRQKESVAMYEEELLDPQANEKLINMMKKIPKADWLIAADAMEACSIAIRNLYEKGLLLETLETLDTA